MPIPGVSFDLVAPHELEAALVLEQEGFPQEEAATLEYLQYRQQNAPELFLGAFTWLPPMPRRLVGFICSTISTSSTLTHDSLSKHEPEGTTVCVHSVVVHPTLQGRGLAVDMVRAYIARLDWQRYHRVRLIAHAPLVGLYQRAGLELIGPSDVQLGPDPWLELGIDLVDEATRNPGRPWTAYASRSGVLRDEAGKSAVDVYCPRRQCRSHILRRGAAEWSENALEPLRDLSAAPTPSPPDFPPSDAPSTASPAWRVVPPSAMTFENISVSKAVPGTPGRKYLGCADCDCGPLGWLGPDEVVLDARRLRYKLE